MKSNKKGKSTENSHTAEWIKFIIMVEDTPPNRILAQNIPHEARMLAERFEGEKIVKAEAVHVWTMCAAKAKNKT